jgi:tetratricopeptide (TPR) repeat protein
MKKVVLFMTLILPLIATAQKEIKPSVSKAEKALKDGKFDEAKAIIDVTTTNQEFMVDKKGNPSKNAAKAWFLKGLIYAGIDTTKVEKFKSLDPNPYQVATESFAKAKELGKEKDGKDVTHFLSDDMGMPLLNDQLYSKLANAYLNQALDSYTNKKDYKSAYKFMERVLYFVPNDTAMLMNAGVYFAPSAEEYDKSVTYIKAYHAKGGKNLDSYRQLISVLVKNKKSEDALAAVREAMQKYPTESDLAQTEISLLYELNRLPEARKNIESKIASGKGDRGMYYNLGVICIKLNDEVAAEKSFKEAIKLDKEDYDSYAQLADMKYKKVRKTREERNEIAGKNDAEIKKRQELFQQIKAELLEALPYWEKCEQLKPTEESVLYGLLAVYGDLISYDETYEAKEKKLKAKMRGLKLEVD